MFKLVLNNQFDSDYLYIRKIGMEKCKSTKPVCKRFFENNNMHFIVDGSGEFNGIPLEAGSGFYIKSGYTAEYTVDKQTPWSYYWIDFSGIEAENILDNLGFNEAYGTFKFNNIERVKEFFEEKFYYDYKNYNLNYTFISLFYQLVSIIPDKNDTDKRSLSAAEDHYRNALVYLKNNFPKKITIDEIAKKENIDRRYMSRLFKTYSGHTPQEMLIRLRIEASKSMLAKTSYSIGKIASEIGYDDVLQFSRIFKKHTSMSPSEFRKKAKK